MSTQWDEQASPQPGVTLTCASSITPEPIAWIWPEWLAAGKLHVLAGMAGTGKTTIALAVAATMTARGRWPDGTDCRTAANVVMWSGEDDAADTLVPRLMAMGADVDRIHLITGTTDDKGQKRGFDPSVDMPMLESTLSEVSPRLLILDPISSAVSGDSHQNTEVRRSLQPVVDLAASLGCAVLGITHFSKGTAGRDPLERVTGSMAFGAFARLVWATIKPAKDADDQKRRLIRTKSNIGPDGGGFEYDLIQTNVPGIGGLYASCILWGEVLEGSARELAGQIEDDKTPGEEKGPSPREEAADFLLEILADGPRMHNDIKELADQDGIASATLKRAKKGLGIVSRKLAQGWEWHLKDWMPDDVQECQGDQEYQNPKGTKTDPLDPLESAEATETPEMLAFEQDGQGDHHRGNLERLNTDTVRVPKMKDHLTPAKSAWERAWWDSGAHARDGMPYLSEEAWTGFAATNRIRGMTRIIGTLLTAAKIAPQDVGWVACEDFAENLTKKLGDTPQDGEV